ncbi:MAG TPA: murein biosynthesis integral membrane protein MurJ [Thermoanaerobaculia bacterium]|nr:murein biosynthesis integral membrane protein MurJ [Thermoanaerobaculia bacterium]
MSAARRSSSANALLVGAGILLSRLAGFVRERVFAHYLGSSMAADALRAALRAPNVLQNLFGEGSLSASLIPVYSRLLGEGRVEEARRTARTAGTLLALLAVLLSALGVLAAPLLVDLFTPGFSGERRELTVRLVRILFPGTGLLVLSAFCLGILNSHRRFFLPYAAPVLWNGAIIAALVLAGTKAGAEIAVQAAWGAVAGSLLQLLVQLPQVARLVGTLRPALDAGSPHVRTIFRNLLPSVGSRGVTQVSSWVDQVIASFLPGGAVAMLGYAQTLYILPVSLFGMSVSSAELPELSSGASAETLRERLDGALRRVAFLVVPSAVAFALLGDRVVALVFQTGAFGAEDVRIVWIVLAAASVGLLASTLGRLYASAFWALHDTRTPRRGERRPRRPPRVRAPAPPRARPAARPRGADARLGPRGLARDAPPAPRAERARREDRSSGVLLPSRLGRGARRGRGRLRRETRVREARPGPPRRARLRRLRRRLRPPRPRPPSPRSDRARRLSPSPPALGVRSTLYTLRDRAECRG